MDTVEEVLDEVERRIREQQKAAEPFSMAWRAHMADIMHVSEVRREYEDSKNFLGEHRVSKKGKSAPA